MKKHNWNLPTKLQMRVFNLMLFWGLDEKSAKKRAKDSLTRDEGDL